MYVVIESTSPFTPDFLKWTLPTLNLKESIILKRMMHRQISKTKWQTV